MKTCQSSQHSRAFSVTVSALDIILGKSLLAFRQSSRPANLPIVFSVGFSFQFSFFVSRFSISVLVSCKCLACKRCCTTNKTLETIETPFSEIFFSKTFSVENTIGVHFVVDYPM